MKNKRQVIIVLTAGLILLLVAVMFYFIGKRNGSSAKESDNAIEESIEMESQDHTDEPELSAAEEQETEETTAEPALTETSATSPSNTDTTAESPTVPDSSAEQSVEDTTDENSTSENTENQENQLSPSKTITDQYPDIAFIAYFNRDEDELLTESQLIEEEDYYIITMANFGYIVEADYDSRFWSTTYLKKDAVVTFYGGIGNTMTMTLEEYFEYYNWRAIRAFNLKTDKNGWIIAFADSLAG